MMISPLRAATRALLLSSGVMIVFAIVAFRQFLPAAPATLQAEIRVPPTLTLPPAPPPSPEYDSRELAGRVSLVEVSTTGAAASIAEAQHDARVTQRDQETVHDEISERAVAEAKPVAGGPAPLPAEVRPEPPRVSKPVEAEPAGALRAAGAPGPRFFPPQMRAASVPESAGPAVAANADEGAELQAEAALPQESVQERSIETGAEPSATTEVPRGFPPSRSPVAVFRALPVDSPEPSPHPALEARMAGLERQLTELVQAQHTEQSLDADQTSALLRQLQQALEAQQAQSAGKGSAEPSAAGLLSAPRIAEEAAGQPAPAAAETPRAGVRADAGSGEAILRAEANAQNPELFSMHFQDAEITEVLNMLGHLAGVNILAGQDVSGKVPAANLQNVTIEEALQSILRSSGFAFERDGNFVFVMTQAEAEARAQLKRKLITKIYRPHYISAQDLQMLIVPLQTKDVGQIAVTAPAEIGISTDAETAGGDQLAQRDAVLVRDYPEVISQIDAVFEELDVPPMQVVIEAMILSVTLDDTMAFGVNFALLNGSSKSLGLVGNGGDLNRSTGFPTGSSDGASLVPPGTEFLANTAGLKYGFLRGDVSMFINALETITDTNLIASPNIRVLNKQRANLIIGEQLAYTTTTQNGTSSIENVNFLEVGTRLIIRPFIAPDGLVRLELHPEQSSGTIDNRNLPNKSTTEVTTNVMVRDGTTVVVGGLIEEQIVESQDRVPFLGAIPVVGNLFRSKTDTLQRRELIVLITPRIVREPEAEIEGEIAAIEHQERADEFRRRISPINQRNLARMDLERAQYFFDNGDLARARRHVELSLKENKNDLDALRLKRLIDDAQAAQRQRWLKWPVGKKKRTVPPPTEIHYEPALPGEVMGPGMEEWSGP